MIEGGIIDIKIFTEQLKFYSKYFLFITSPELFFAKFVINKKKSYLRRA